MNTAIMLLSGSLFVGILVIFSTSYILAQETISENSILNNESLLNKFNEGYTEVCFKNIVHENDPNSSTVRTCLLDADKWKIEGSNPFYIRMLTDDFCAYRYHEIDQYYSGHKGFGQIYDGKADNVCHVPFELNWERRTWDISYTTVDEFGDKEFILMTMYKEHRTIK